MTESRLSIVIDSRSAEQQARDLEKAMLDLGKDLMSELEAEFGRIVRH